MDRETIQLFLNKKVRIYQNNKFHYVGYIIKVTESSLVLNDRYDGIMILNLNDIFTIKEVKDEKEKEI